MWYAWWCQSVLENHWSPARSWISPSLEAQSLIMCAFPAPHRGAEQSSRVIWAGLQHFIPSLLLHTATWALADSHMLLQKHWHWDCSITMAQGSWVCFPDTHWALFRRTPDTLYHGYNEILEQRIGVWTCSCIPVMLDVLFYSFLSMPRPPAVRLVEKEALEYSEKQLSLGWLSWPMSGYGVLKCQVQRTWGRKDLTADNSAGETTEQCCSV